MKIYKIGFTLIELLITTSIIMMVIIFVITVNQSGLGSPIMSEMFQRGGTLCKNGYMWNVDINGHQRQVIGANGGGVPCN